MTQGVLPHLLYILLVQHLAGISLDSAFPLSSRFGLDCSTYSYPAWLLNKQLLLLTNEKNIYSQHTERLSHSMFVCVCVCVCVCVPFISHFYDL